MAREIILQLALLILTLALIFISLLRLKNPKLPLPNKTNQRSPSARHVAQASRLLDRARGRPALAQADAAISIAPRSAEAHLLKAAALEQMGRRALALRSLDAALSPPRVRSLDAAARADALVKRAELSLAVKRRRRVESAVEDLTEAVERFGAGSRALGLLGQCYEWKGMRDEASEVYEKMLADEPGSVVAREGLDRLMSFST